MNANPDKISYLHLRIFCLNIINKCFFFREAKIYDLRQAEFLKIISAAIRLRKSRLGCRMFTIWNINHVKAAKLMNSNSFRLILRQKSHKIFILISRDSVIKKLSAFLLHREFCQDEIFKQTRDVSHLLLLIFFQHHLRNAYTVWFRKERLEYMCLLSEWMNKWGRYDFVIYGKITKSNTSVVLFH